MENIEVLVSQELLRVSLECIIKKLQIQMNILKKTTCSDEENLK